MKNLLQTKYPSFYKYDAKGISVYSVTEPILKFIIFSSLCLKYQIWPESSFYNSKELLDIALFSKPIKNIDNEIEPDIAIEIKWAYVTKSGKLNKWSLTSLINDVYKLHKRCETLNKYVMQFLVLKDYNTEISNAILEEQVYNEIDKRKIRGKQVSFCFKSYFDTHGKDENEKWKFYLLLWKIV